MSRKRRKPPSKNGEDPIGVANIPELVPEEKTIQNVSLASEDDEEGVMTMATTNAQAVIQLGADQKYHAYDTTGKDLGIVQFTTAAQQQTANSGEQSVMDKTATVQLTDDQVEKIMEEMKMENINENNIDWKGVAITAAKGAACAAAGVAVYKVFFEDKPTGNDSFANNVEALMEGDSSFGIEDAKF